VLASVRVLLCVCGRICSVVCFRNCSCSSSFLSLPHSKTLCSLALVALICKEIPLQTVAEQFAHVLLFGCPQCGRPLASACASTQKNLEGADAHWFNPHCHCGWTGEVIGVTALKHWVEPWGKTVPVGTDVPGSCEGRV
jgi:hypothetical protein